MVDHQANISSFGGEVPTSVAESDETAATILMTSTPTKDHPDARHTTITPPPPPTGSFSPPNMDFVDVVHVTNQTTKDYHNQTGVYTGTVSQSTGMPHGQGRFEYEEKGRWYEGDWIHGRWTGYGQVSNGEGDFYEGGLKNDLKHGTGVMRFADGRVFEGEYIRGQMIQGKMTYQDGSVYGGSWVDGMRHGRGKCIFVDGSEYEGEFREGNFHGHGRMTWNDGGWYVGEWNNGKMHGRGTEVLPDGSVRHDGDWLQGYPVPCSLACIWYVWHNFFFSLA
jgi:hypothetical protein